MSSKRQLEAKWANQVLQQDEDNSPLPNGVSISFRTEKIDPNQGVAFSACISRT
jgi:hypothetical protein